MKGRFSVAVAVSVSVWVLFPALGRAARARDVDGQATQKQELVDQLSEIRGEVMGLQQNLIDSLKTQKQARASLRKIQLLLKLQRRERALGQRRLAELESTIKELESRRTVLNDKVRLQQAEVRGFLVAIEASTAKAGAAGASPHLPEQERIEAPRRKVLANLADRGIKELEALKVDLADADKLESRIQDEKQQLAYLFQDLREQEGVLELNRDLQRDLLEKKHEERIAQLESYRRLKSAESQVERLIGDFNARLELERSQETEKIVAKAMVRGLFPQLKGKLPLPVDAGRVVSSYGRAFDAKSGLYIFKKGIDISVGKKEPVKAISAGKVAYSGELPDYGRVAIIDHGDHYYSLCAHLGELSRKAGDPVAAGDVLGTTDESGTPVYFEIRARNMPVNPLQWVSNEFKLK